MTDGSNVVRLFYEEQDLEAAWQDFDTKMRAMHALYADEYSSEAERRDAANAAARAELMFRAVFARLRPAATAA